MATFQIFGLCVTTFCLYEALLFLTTIMKLSDFEYVSLEEDYANKEGKNVDLEKKEKDSFEDIGAFCVEISSQGKEEEFAKEEKKRLDDLEKECKKQLLLINEQRKYLGKKTEREKQLFVFNRVSCLNEERCQFCFFCTSKDELNWRRVLGYVRAIIEKRKGEVKKIAREGRFIFVETIRSIVVSFVMQKVPGTVFRGVEYPCFEIFQIDPNNIFREKLDLFE